MRVRITRPRVGEVDGIDLKKFQKGVTYDVSPSLGTYLVTTGSAELVEANEPAADESLLSEIRFAAAVETFHEVANEMRRARRRKRR